MNQTANLCFTCRKPKAAYHCQLCQEQVCKNCAQFIDENEFSYLKSIPEELKHTTYCLNCFNEKVSTPLENYKEMLVQAKEIIIFYKSEGKITRLLERKQKPYQVENCVDEDEALLKLSMYAVQDKFNALIDINLTSKKIINGSHKKLTWTGTAMPLLLNEKELRQTSFYQED